MNFDASGSTRPRRHGRVLRLGLRRRRDADDDHPDGEPHVRGGELHRHRHADRRRGLLGVPDLHGPGDPLQRLGCGEGDRTRLDRRRGRGRGRRHHRARRSPPRSTQKQKGSLKIAVKAGAKENVEVVASGTATFKGFKGKIALKKAKGSAKAGKTATLKLKAKKKDQGKAVVGLKGKAKISVKLTDSDGDTLTKKNSRSS